MSHSKKRRQRSATDKMRIVLAGMEAGVEISELCRVEGINPTQYYRWQTQLVSGTEAVFGKRRGGQDGTGKELMAEAIHAASPRRTKSLSSPCPMNITTSHCSKKPFGLDPLVQLGLDWLGESPVAPRMEIQSVNLLLMDQGLREGYKHTRLLWGQACHTHS